MKLNKFFKKVVSSTINEDSKDTKVSSNDSIIKNVHGYIVSNKKLETQKVYTEYKDFLNFKIFPDKDKFMTSFNISLDIGNLCGYYEILDFYLYNWGRLKKCNHLYMASIEYSIGSSSKSLYFGNRIGISNVKIEKELDILQTLHDENKFKYLFDLNKVHDYKSYEEYMTREFFERMMVKNYINIIMNELRHKYDTKQKRCDKLDQVAYIAENLFEAGENLNSIDAISLLLT